MVMTADSAANRSHVAPVQDRLLGYALNALPRRHGGVKAFVLLDFWRKHSDIEDVFPNCCSMEDIHD